MKTRKEQGNMNPNSLANLEKGKFKKGVSANPRGNYKGTKHRNTLLKNWMNTEMTTNDLNGSPVLVSAEDAVILALIKKAMSGDVKAIKEVLDSLYGKQSIPIEATPQFQTARDVLVHGFNECLKEHGIDKAQLTNEERKEIESAFGQYLAMTMNLWNEGEE